VTAKTPYRDGKGATIGVIGIARDITELWLAEREREITVQLLNFVNGSNGNPRTLR
jgi:hypothetical protein